MKKNGHINGYQPEKIVGTQKPPTGVSGLPSHGLKFDHDKVPMNLLSTIWLAEVSRVLKFGCEKYGAHNWRNGIGQSRLMAAAMRHITSYNDGEDNDHETGLSHLAHASCCMMFAFELAKTMPHTDDRYKIRKECNEP